MSDTPLARGVCRPRRAVLALALVLAAAIKAPSAVAMAPATSQVGQPLTPWRPGLLDIHHISTGRGNATFVIMPDGTTMLIDAGELDPAAFARFAPLKLGPERPYAGAGAGRTIANYIARHAPPGRPPALDYAVVTHYHDDHIGAMRPEAPLSKTSGYRLTGLAAVAARIDIHRLLDRGEEDGVAGLASGSDAAYANYRAFTRDAAVRSQLKVETLRAGSSDQIAPVHDLGAASGFSVRVLKTGRWLWNGVDDGRRELFSKAQASQAGKAAENALSVALLIRYGAFSYFSGGDNPGLGSPERAPWQDVETPLAAVVGPVEAMTLDHHGNRDANNATLLASLAPRVVIQQCWTSDQPGQEVVQRLVASGSKFGEPQAFATQISPEAAAAIGPPMRRLFNPVTGHVVLRVAPGGRTYDLFVLDDKRKTATIRFAKSASTMPRPVDKP